MDLLCHNKCCYLCLHTHTLYFYSSYSAISRKNNWQHSIALCKLAFVKRSLQIAHIPHFTHFFFKQMHFICQIVRFFLLLRYFEQLFSKCKFVFQCKCKSERRRHGERKRHLWPSLSLFYFIAVLMQRSRLNSSILILQHSHRIRLCYLLLSVCALHVQCF